jgi:hypothetical protein
MKYCNTVKTFAEVRGNRRFDDFARGLGHQTAHTGQLTHLSCEPRAPESAMMYIGLKLGIFFSLPFSSVVESARSVPPSFRWRPGFGDLRPDVDDLVVTFAVRDETFGVLVFEFLRLLCKRHQAAVSLPAGTFMSSMQIEMPARVAYSKPVFFRSVGKSNSLLVARRAVTSIDQFGDGLLVHDLG